MSYQIRLTTTMIKRLTNHKHELVKEYYEAQKNSNFTEMYYMSPICLNNSAVIETEFELVNSPSPIPKFYTRVTAGTYRG